MIKKRDILIFGFLFLFVLIFLLELNFNYSGHKIKVNKNNELAKDTVQFQLDYPFENIELDIEMKYERKKFIQNKIDSDNKMIEEYERKKEEECKRIELEEKKKKYNIDFLAKLLYAEAGSMGWEGQIYVCSSILNLCEYSGVSVWTAGHNVNMFSVAPYVDSIYPSNTQYEIINHVLSGGRIYGIKYFRTNYYHSFGTPVCNVENVYFSN